MKDIYYNKQEWVTMYPSLNNADGGKLFMANSKDNAPKVNRVPQGKKAKNKKKKKKHPVLFTFFLIFFCIFVAGMLTAISVGGSVLSYVDEFVNGSIAIDLDNYKNSQNQTSIMYGYDSEKNLVELARLHGEENRIWVDYDEMPQNLLNAFICLEDKRFYEHSGVDFIRTIGVIVIPERWGQGGSTITQQLIKNLTNDNEATFNRKFNEIIRALNLEKHYSKKEILEAYLNTVSLGAGCYGVKTAAETYFGKDVSELTLLECATLAGITQSPYSKNPYADYELCMKRKDTCLDKMRLEGKITQKQYDKYYGMDVKVKPKGSATTELNDSEENSEIYSWYEEYVITQVIADLQEEYNYDYQEAYRKVYYGGLKIYAAVDLDVQKILEDAYKNRTGFPYANKDEYGQLPDSSMVVMDYQGRIVGLVGGTGKKTANRAYNRATDPRAKRQPGSSIKPLAVYAPAIDQGLVTPSSLILDKALEKYNNGKDWPQNFNGDHGSEEYLTVEEALVRSLNTIPVRILKESLGTGPSLKYCNERFHLNLGEKDKDLSPLAVGGTNTGVTTLEMAAAFATFGNGGRYFEPYSYYQVTDRNGNVLLDRTKEQPEQAIKDSTAQSMLGMLTKAVTQSNGTGYGSKISRFQTFAKTGTTSENCDKWYCGGTPHYVTAVWYGYNNPSNLRTGSSNPAKTIYHSVLSKVHQNLPAKTFDQTEAAVDNYIAMNQEG